MKIAHCIEFYEPSKGGVQYHTKLLSEYLSSKNKIDVITSYHPDRKPISQKNVYIKDFNITGNLVRGYRGEVEKYQDFLLTSNFDILMFYAAQQWSFDLALPILNKIKGKKIFLPCGFSNYNKILYNPYYNVILKNKINFFDEIVCFSKKTYDYQFCKKNFKKKISIIPNGGEKFKKKKRVKKNIILCVANFTILKNQLSIILCSFFFKKKTIINFVYSKKTKYFYFCYYVTSLIFLFRKKAEFNFHYNLSKKEISQQYLNSKFFLFTSKVECAPLVITDCLTSGLYFISSKVGNVEEMVKKYKFGSVYDSYIQLINKVNFQLSRPAKIKKNNSLEWKNILKLYNKVYNVKK